MTPLLPLLCLRRNETYRMGEETYSRAFLCLWWITLHIHPHLQFFHKKSNSGVFCLTLSSHNKVSRVFFSGSKICRIQESEPLKVVCCLQKSTSLWMTNNDTAVCSHQCSSCIFWLLIVSWTFQSYAFTLTLLNIKQSIVLVKWDSSRTFIFWGSTGIYLHDLQKNSQYIFLPITQWSAYLKQVVNSDLFKFLPPYTSCLTSSSYQLCRLPNNIIQISSSRQNLIYCLPTLCWTSLFSILLFCIFHQSCSNLERK